VSAADTDRPDTDRGSGSSSGQPPRPRCPVPQLPQTPAAMSGCPAGCGRTAADPQPPFRHHGSAAHVALGCAGQVGQGRCSRRVAAVRTCGHRTRGHRTRGHRTRGHRTRPVGHREPARPGAVDTCDRRRGMRSMRQRPRWTAGTEASTTAAMSDRNGTAMCGTGQYPCLTARSVVWGRPESQRRPVKAAQVRTGPPLR
jgi:hypothetical protein